MRYRIIKEANLNNEVFFEVHLYRQVDFLFFFKKWKWDPVIEHKRQAEFFFTRTARYETFEEAQKVVNKYATKRTLSQEGEIETDDAYKV
jgi:hypothetical protein